MNSHLRRTFFFSVAVAWLFLGCATAQPGARASGTDLQEPQPPTNSQVTLDVSGCKSGDSCSYALKLEDVTFRSESRGLKLQVRIVEGPSAPKVFNLAEVWAGHSGHEPVSLVDLSSLPITDSSKITVSFSEVDVRTGETTELKSITVGSAAIVKMDKQPPQ